MSDTEIRSITPNLPEYSNAQHFEGVHCWGTGTQTHADERGQLLYVRVRPCSSASQPRTSEQVQHFLRVVHGVSYTLYRSN
jgi:hypothetical protein